MDLCLQDIAAMGRLVGLPHFFTQAALDEEKNDSNDLRRAKVECAQEAGTKDSLKHLQVVIALRMQTQFRGRIIRRHKESKDYEGKIIQPLPGCISKTLLLKLTDHEMEIVTELADEVKEKSVIHVFGSSEILTYVHSVSASNSSLYVVSRAFYVNHRRCVGYARLKATDPIPTFKTLDSWEEKKSVKFDTCARLTQYVLTSDLAPVVECKDGVVEFPPIPPPPPGVEVPQTTKVLIYQEFPSLMPLMINVSLVRTQLLMKI